MKRDAPELWIPRHTQNLVVGTRVRIRLNGECDGLLFSGEMPLGLASYYDGHADIMQWNGTSGVIYRIYTDPHSPMNLWPHHPYVVEVGFAVANEYGHRRKIHLAATEIELLD